MLDNLDNKKNPFTVPENYFEGLTKSVMDNLPAREVEVKKVPLWRKALPWTGVAAVVAVVAIAIGTFGDMPQTTMAENGEGEEMVRHEQNMVYNEVEDYFLFLEDEAIEAEYEEVLFNEVF